MINIKEILILTIFTMAILTEKKEKKEPYSLNLNKDNLSQSYDSDFMENINGNLYKIKLEDTSLITSKSFFLIFESENLDFFVSLYDTSNSLELSQKNVNLELKTYSGNLLLAMSDSFFNSKLDYFKETGELYFKVNLNHNTGEKTNYRIKLIIHEELSLTFGKIYTTRLDFLLNELTINLIFDEKQNFEIIKKMRFQLTSVIQKDKYDLSSSLNVNESSYLMNKIFKNIVGGILKEPEMKLCKSKDCRYKMKMVQTGVKILNIESFLIEEKETLSVNHLNEYYDKCYTDNSIAYYILKYIDDMEGLDISISLIPVTGESELYVNISTQPNQLDKFDFKEVGTLAKRITIKWSDLVLMKSEKSDLYIAVKSKNSGEFMIKIDAHENGYRGRLTSGTLEAGFVKKDELINYLYAFEVFETKNIQFNVNLSIISGDANLYLKQCESLIDCKLNNEDIKTAALDRVENNHSDKTLTKTIKCEKQLKHKMSQCRFLISVKGKINNGTHFHISLHEDRYHTLLLPGMVLNVNLLQDELKYVKFSMPPNNKGNAFIFSVEVEWGSFDVFINKTDEYPSATSYTIKESFNQYQKSKNILINIDTLREDISGVYYVAISASASSSLNVKFYVQKDNTFTLHSLSAGSHQKGTLSDPVEILYYSTKISLDSSNSNIISVDLTPIKGKFIIFASNTGSLPTKTKNDIISLNNQLNLKYDEENDDYIIGVQRVMNGESGDGTEDFQGEFYLNLSYSDKSTRLKPGVIYTHTMKDINFYLIEVLTEMEDILILKGVTDGYNIRLCARFGGLKKNSGDCDGEANDKNVSLYFKKEEINLKCEKILKKGERCFLQLIIEGYSDQKYTIGFTYNSLPFQIVDEVLITGPTLLKKPLYFVYELIPNQDVGFYFNTKGRKMNMYTLLTQGDDIELKSKTSFPNAANFNERNKIVSGHITTFLYSVSEISEVGSKPEILISIYPDEKTQNNKDEHRDFDPANPFYLQSFLDVKEIARTHVFSEYILEEEYRYYQFYNNGNSDFLRVYVNSNHISNLQVTISRDYQSRPPYTGNTLMTQKGLNSVVMELNKGIINGETKGHYTVGVKSNFASLIHIYWNNKEDLDYLELTPNIPAVVNTLNDKKLYFSFFVDETEKEKKNITIHVKSDSKTEIYILSSKDNSLMQPALDDYHFKGNIGSKGGVSLITIRPTDTNYCLNCTYVGQIVTEDTTQLTILFQIEHDNLPIALNSGLNFPDYLDPHHNKKYRFINIGDEPIYLHLSLLSGTVNVFIDNEENVNMAKNKIEVYMNKNMEINKFIVIDPKEYNLQSPQNIFILVENSKLDPATYSLSIFKKNNKIPIEPGVTKYMELGPNEETSFFFSQTLDETEFEIRVILQKVENVNLSDKAIQALIDMIEIFYESTENDSVKIEIAKKSLYNNVLYLQLNLTQNNNRNFVIKTKNFLDTGITFTVDLLVGNYKLLNLNQTFIDTVEATEIQIYESYGHLGRFIFFNIKMCIGEVTTEFFEGDFNKIIDKKHTNYKTVKEDTSYVHYFKLDDERIFTKVTNANKERAVFKLFMYNEQDMDSHPYLEINQGNDGKVQIDSDNRTIKFKMLTLKNLKTSRFIHKVKFSSIASTELSVMKYIKNCGTFKIDEYFNSPDYHRVDQELSFASTELLNSYTQELSIQIGNLLPGKKYYGVLIAEIMLMPLEEGYIEPVKSRTVFYDEFIIVNSKIFVPLNSIVAYGIVLSFLFVLFYIIKQYVFNDVSKIQSGQDLKNLRNLLQRDTVRNILESEYYGDSDPRRKEVSELDLDNNNDKKEIELGNLDDRKSPLD